MKIREIRALIVSNERIMRVWLTVYLRLISLFPSFSAFFH
jgi:hypothetical protein